MTFSIRTGRLAGRAGMASVLLGGTALAQTAPPATIPGLDTFSLPSSRPTPRPTPTPAPTTRPSEPSTVAPVPPRPTPTPAVPPAPTPRPASTPAPATAAPPTTATPVATPSPVATPQALPPEAAPIPQSAAEAAEPVAPPPAPTPAPRPQGMRTLFDPAALAGLALAAVLLALFGLARWWRNRPVREREERRRDTQHEVFALGVEGATELPPPPVTVPAPTPSPAVPAPAPPAAIERATLEIELVPKRAGTNLLSASVEYSLAIRNSGALAATGVRLDIRLLSAGPQQDAILADLFARPVTQPIAPPFDVPPADTLMLDGMVMHPKETLTLLDVAGQALFVPVLAVVARYGWSDGANEGSGRTARSYVIGMVRGEGSRLRPFRRDSARMFETVAALDYSLVLDA